jgi:hypothetical protein
MSAPQEKAMARQLLLSVSGTALRTASLEDVRFGWRAPKTEAAGECY